MKMIDLNLERSDCGKYVRITLGEHVVVLTMGEWSDFISHPQKFKYEPKKKVS